jgi:hypothetical protein
MPPSLPFSHAVTCCAHCLLCLARHWPSRTSMEASFLSALVSLADAAGPFLVLRSERGMVEARFSCRGRTMPRVEAVAVKCRLESKPWAQLVIGASLAGAAVIAAGLLRRRSAELMREEAILDASDSASRGVELEGMMLVSRRSRALSALSASDALNMWKMQLQAMSHPHLIYINE